MTKEATYTGIAASGDVVQISLYNVDYAVIDVIRLDNLNNTGDVYVANRIQKQYTYADTVYKFDSAVAMYDFTTPNPHNAVNLVALNRSTATAPVESISNHALALVGGTTLQASSLVVPRFVNHALQLQGTIQASDTVAQGQVSFAENGGTPWSIRAWVFRFGISSWVYLETNAAITNYIGMFLSAAGHITLQWFGGLLWDTGILADVTTWNQIAITYDGTNLRCYKNGVLAAGPIAHTHATGLVTTIQRLNHGAANQHLSGPVTIHNVALSATQINRDYLDMTQDYTSGGILTQGGTMGQGSTYEASFTDAIFPELVQSAAAPTFAVLPLVGYGYVSFGGTGAAYGFDVKIVEREIGQ